VTLVPRFGFTEGAMFIFKRSIIGPLLALAVSTLFVILDLLRADTLTQ
jgi:hypothetical protein